MVDVDYGEDEAYSIAIQSSGRIVLAGTSFDSASGNYGFSWVRFNIDGSLDRPQNINGTSTNDSLVGSLSDDTLNAYGGNDVLNGLGGADTMIGGDGSDTYYVGDTGDVVSETNATASTGGTDTVYSYLSAYTLGANVENGHILATGAANLTGNSLANTLTGNALANVLDGGTGNDTLDGGSGVDTAIFSGLSASYSVTKTSTGYTVNDNVGSDGTDTLTNIERLQFIDKTIAFNIDGKVVLGGTGNDTLTGGAGNDTLDGGAGLDTAVFSGSKAGYALTRTSSGMTAVSASDGTDALITSSASNSPTKLSPLISTATPGRLIASTKPPSTGCRIRAVWVIGSMR